MNIKKNIKKVVAPVRLIWGYFSDFKRFEKYSFEFNSKSPSKENLRSEITFECHAIEKGLSHDNLRLGFGEAHRKKLLGLLHIWINKKLPTDDKRFLMGIAVLNRFVAVHEQNNYDVTVLKENLAYYQKYLADTKLKAGSIVCNKEKLMSNNKQQFDIFSTSRRSIRNYGRTIISKNTVLSAIELATNYPSVCNRQAVKVHLITNIKIAKECLRIQNGIQGMANNLSGVIVITCDDQYFGNLNERNQSFIDGGIFTMNILYALTFNKIASCALNADLNTRRMKQIRKLVTIPESENIIAFISYGSYPEVCRFPISNRDNAADITSIVE